MQVPTHEEMLAAIDAFQVRHPEIKDARFGREATGEPGLVARLRRGSSPTLQLLERVRAYMTEKDGAADRSGEGCDHSPVDGATLAEVLAGDVVHDEGVTP